MAELRVQLGLKPGFPLSVPKCGSEGMPFALLLSDALLGENRLVPHLLADHRFQLGF